MKRIMAYEASDGSVHKTKVDAGRASLRHLSSRIEGRGDALPAGAVDAIIKHRDEITKILYQIDAPEAEELPYKKGDA